MLSSYVAPGLPKKVISASTTGLAEAERITSIVCNYLEMPYEKVKSKGRKMKMVYARFVCMYFIRARTSLSLHDIGNFFSQRDHTTVIKSLKKLREDAVIYAKIRRDIENIQQLIIYGNPEEKKPLPVREAGRAGR